MPTTSGKPRAMTHALPRKSNFYIADDIRLEQGGKPSLLGFFPDNVVVVPIPEKTKSPTQKEPIAVFGLAFLANFPDATGSYSLGMEFLAPGDVILLKSTDGRVATEKDPGINVITRLQPFPIVAFGIHKLIVTLNKKQFRFSFEVRRGVAEPSHQQPGVLLTPEKHKQKARQKK